MMGRKRWRQYRVLPDIAVIRFGNEQVVRGERATTLLPFGSPHGMVGGLALEFRALDCSEYRGVVY
jgi:hypothetical protein